MSSEAANNTYGNNLTNDQNLSESSQISEIEKNQIIERLIVILSENRLRPWVDIGLREEYQRRHNYLLPEDWLTLVTEYGRYRIEVETHVTSNRSTKLIQLALHTAYPNPDSGTDINDIQIRRTVNEWMSTDLVQQFLSMNVYPLDLVKMVLQQRYLSHNRPFDSLADIYDMVSALPEPLPSSRSPVPETQNQESNNGVNDDKTCTIDQLVQEFKSLNLSESDPMTERETTVGERPPSSLQLVPSVGPNENPSLNIEIEPIPSTSQQSSAQPSPHEMSSFTWPTNIETEPIKTDEREMSKTNDTFICKICYSAEIEVVFLPCGHQMACNECAQKLINCPFCRQLIKLKVRTYFS